jgi:serine/threonine protein kinase
MLLDSSDIVKLADFAGSSIGDIAASVNYAVRSRLPGVSKPTKKSDIFALGSAMYEMATGHPPYEKLSNSTVQKLYRKGEFPADVDDVPGLGKTIRKCWEQRFDSAWDVLSALGGLSDTDPPEILDLEDSPSKLPRRHRDSHTIYVSQISQRRQKSHSEREAERVPEKQRKKKHSQGPFMTWINRSIHPWTGPARTSHEKQCYYY